MVSENYSTPPLRISNGIGLRHIEKKRSNLAKPVKDVPGGMTVFFTIIDLSHSYFTTIRPIASAIGRGHFILPKIVVLLHV